MLDFRNWCDLRHLYDLMIITGWKNYSESLRELEELGLVKGEWIGSLKMEPWPCWKLTDKGIKLYEKYKGEMTMFDKGDRVNTPQGVGAVAYRRMKSPDYIEADVYSVVLDTKKTESEQPPFPFYSGTIFPAEEVSKEL